MTDNSKKYNLYQLMSENVGSKEKPGFILTSLKSKKDRFNEDDVREMSVRMVREAFAEAKDEIVGIRYMQAVISATVASFAALTAIVFHFSPEASIPCYLVTAAGILYGGYASQSASKLSTSSPYDAKNHYLPDPKAPENEAVYRLAETKINKMVAEQLKL